MKITTLILLIFLTLNIAACKGSEPGGSPEPVVENQADSLMGQTTKITITIGQQVLRGTLNDNPTTRDFISQLPLTLTLRDYSNFEKISILQKPLTTQGAPAGSTPSAGDIAFYSPWGNLALFHRDFNYSTGLVMMGKFDSDISILRVPGEVTAKIELATQAGN